MKYVLILLFGLNSLYSNAQQTVCATALNNVHTDSLVNFMKILTGKKSAMIQNSEQTILSRYAFHPGNTIAAEYLKQTVIQYGWTVEDIPYSVTGRNIVAYKTGTIEPKRAYLLGAHYDCVGNATMDFQGADDNASGSAALLETARVLQNQSFPYTLVLAFWDEEEIGLLGSAAFAPDGPIGYWDIHASIHLDMIGYDGNNDSLALVHSYSSGYSNTLATKMVEANRLYQTGLNLKTKKPGETATDHYSFWLKGSTAIGLTEDYDADFNPNWHQLSDSLGNMNIPYWTKMSKLALATICDITQTGNYVSVKEAATIEHFTLYPNPVSDMVYLPNTLDWNEGVFEVYTLMGEKILSTGIKSNRLDVSILAPGLYQLVFKTRESTYVSRFVKQ